MKCTFLALMLFASLAVAQVTTEGPIPPTTVEADTEAIDTTFKPDGGNTMDPAISGCRNQYHVIVPDGTACNDRCNGKLERAKYEATIKINVYPSKFGQGTCCNCNFKRTPGTEGENLAPDSDSDSDSDNGTPATDDSSPTSGVLDPTTFKPPTNSELVIAVDPNYVQIPEPNETNTYAVLRVIGTTGFTTPLSTDYILGFVYAFNNVTGIPFQYKGDAPSIPSDPAQYPAAPNGYPQVKNGAPPAAPPAAVVAPTVDPAADATTVPVDPAADTTTVPVDPAADTTTVPVDPAAVPVVPAPVRRLLRSASASRRLVSPFPKVKRNSHRHLLQDAGTGQYLYSPMPESEDYGSSNTGDYSSDYSSDYGNDYGSTPSPSPTDYGSDYFSPSGGDYGNSPSPDIYYQSPSPDPYAAGSYDDDDDAYSSLPVENYGESPPEFASPPEFTSPPPEFTSPPPEFFSPPPSPEVVFSVPPAPVGAPLPPDADGIWYFSMQPLSDSKFRIMGEALNQATGEGTGDFLKYLNSAGVPATGVELRYYGQATEGEIDLTKKIDGDLFGAASYGAPPVDEGSKMSTATIGAIVGGVVGGVVLIAIAGILVASNRRKSTKTEKAALTQRWKTERELVENERVKLEAEASGAVYANGGISTNRSRNQNSAHDAGFVAMTSNDLEQQRSMRRAATMAAEAKLSSKQLGIEASPSMSAKSAGGTTSKPSRLDSMRAALGLNKSSSVIKKNKSTDGATAAPAVGVGAPAMTTPSAAPRSSSFAWTVEGGQGISPLNSTRSLRSQFSTGAGAEASSTTSSRFGGDMEAPSSTGAGDKPSPFGRMFSKK